MELKLTLHIRRGTLLPLNYQYELSSWIYKVIERADSEYSTFLHEKGFATEGRSFKLFTFSQLDLRPYQIRGNQIELLGKAVSLNLRFMVDASVENFVKGLFMQQRFGLGDKSAAVDFEVSGIETLAAPLFKTTMRYQCLSPICVSRLRPDRTAEYLSPEVAGYGGLIVDNLNRKTKALVAAVADGYPGTTPVDCSFKLLNVPRKKGIHIKAHTASHTQVIGYLFHFELTAPVEFHEMGYNAGFGEKNSMGFGCVAEMSN